MRVAVLAVFCLALAACGEPEQAAPDAAGEPAKTAMETEAEKVCAAMTTFSPEKIAGKPPETQALLRREYDLCVKTVSIEDNETPPPPPTQAAEAPALRGRSN